MTEHYEAILRLLDAVPVRGGFWKARCPVHQGQPRNLRVWIGRHGNLMVGCWRCHGSQGGPAKRLWLQEFCQALGITMSDLYPPRDPNQPPPARPVLVATYVYEDENGQPLHRKLRFKPKSFAQERWSPEEQRWIPGLGPHDQHRRVLYHLPRLLDSPLEMVWVVEGEGKVELLESWGLTATCCPDGSALWLDSYARLLSGRDIVLLPDNDTPGRRFMDQTAGSLLRHGVSSLSVINLGQQVESAVEGYDVKDFDQDGGCNANVLYGILKKTPCWSPKTWT